MRERIFILSAYVVLDAGVGVGNGKFCGFVNLATGKSDDRT